MIFKSRWLDVLHRIRQGAAPAEVSPEGTSAPSSPTENTTKRTFDSLDSESQRGNSEGLIGDPHQWILSPDGPGKILWCSISWDRAAVVLRDDLVNLSAGSRPVRFFEWAELHPMPRAPPRNSSAKKPNRGGKNQSLF